MADRYYMNKVFGRGLDRARQIAEAAQEGGSDGKAKRVTIEPQQSGGHRVIVERDTSVEASPLHGGEGDGRSEHSFASPEDVLDFLREVLNGRAPDRVGSAENGAGKDAGDDEDFTCR